MKKQSQVMYDTVMKVYETKIGSTIPSYKDDIRYLQPLFELCRWQDVQQLKDALAKYLEKLINASKVKDGVCASPPRPDVGLFHVSAMTQTCAFPLAWRWECGEVNSVPLLIC